jgi:hypothetical protein
MFIDNQQKTTVSLSGAMGLNASLQPADISENELSTAYNVWFDAGSGKLVTRGGIVANATNKLPNPITILKSFARLPGEVWGLCVSDSKLYYDNAGTWTHIADLESEEPMLEVFNGKLYVADGSNQGLLTWEGTTVARLAGSPQASTVFVANNSLICNDVRDSELDAVYISAPETDDFDTATSGAVIIRAGYGDGMAVNGFAAISNTLVVSKTSKVLGTVSKKTLYGINMDGPASGWSANYISNNNAAVGPHAIQAVAQDILYIDTNGIEALTPTQKYGDISTDPLVGGRVNSRIIYSLSNVSLQPKIKYIPNLAATFFLIGGDIYVLSSLTGAFTEVNFDTVINDIESHGDEVYLAGDEGQLYRVSTVGTDEVVAGNPLPFSSVVGFKMISGSGDLLLTQSHLDLDYITPGTYKVMCSSGERNERTVLQIVDYKVSAGDELLHDATYDLATATQDLGSVGSERRIPCRAKFRGDGIKLQISTSNGGRLSFGRVSAHITQIGR